MKYQGSIAQVKAVQTALLANKKLCAVDKTTGWRGEPGVPPSTLYKVRLVLADPGSLMGPNYKDFLFWISFTYEERDNRAECWLEDKHLGRFCKVFPEAWALFVKLTPLRLPPEQAALNQASYRMREVFNRGRA